MVRRLVRRGLLRALSRTESARTGEREPARLARRFVAASHQGDAHGGAFEYSAGVPIRRLRIPNRADLDDLADKRSGLMVHGRMSGCATVPRVCASLCWC